jgi:UDP-N-acetyl-D-galactosamine dehydrogenase
LHGINIETINSKNKVDALIVAVGHNEYRLKSAEELKSYCRGSNPVIADVKSIYKKQDLIDQGFSVFRL